MNINNDQITNKEILWKFPEKKRANK